MTPNGVREGRLLAICGIFFINVLSSFLVVSKCLEFPFTCFEMSQVFLSCLKMALSFFSMIEIAIYPDVDSPSV